MTTKPLILAAQIILSALTCNLASAQLNKSDHQAVVYLKSPGNCTGTGFFVGSQAILTASHVAQTVRVEVYISGKRYYATVQKRNDEIDYCELRISGYSCPKPLKTSAKLTHGETVYSYGYPGTKKLNSTSGILGISCGFYYFGGAGEMGMSGGPVVNSKGLVIGMVTNRNIDGGTLFRTLPK